MKYFSQITLIGSALAASLFIGCGSSTTTTTSSGTSGTAVDPYIVGAKFYVKTLSDVNDTTGTCTGKTSYVSTASTSSGTFSFTENIPTNAIVKICQDTKGYHNGSAFDSNLSTVLNSSNTKGILSPMTSLIANGSTAANIISKLNTAGLTGVTEADIYTNPLSVTGALDNNATYSKIIATVSINLMMKMQSDYSVSDLNTTYLAPAISMMKKFLNGTNYTAMGGAGANITAADLASMAVSISEGIADKMVAQATVGTPLITVFGAGNIAALSSGFNSTIMGQMMTSIKSGNQFKVRFNGNTPTIAETVKMNDLANFINGTGNGTKYILDIDGNTTISNDANITLALGNYSETNSTGTMVGNYTVSVSTPGRIDVAPTDGNSSFYWIVKGEKIERFRNATQTIYKIMDINSSI